MISSQKLLELNYGHLMTAKLFHVLVFVTNGSCMEGQLIDTSLNSLFIKTTTICKTMESIR